MIWKTPLSVLVVGFSSSLIACSATAPQKDSPTLAVQTPEKPNIIYILADDLGYGDIGVNGQKYIKTPNIDMLAKKGMLFTQHYSGAPVCAPSRSTLITGKHTGRTQVRGNGGAKNDAYLAAGTPTLGNVLQSAGYITGTIGKWGLGSYEDDGAPNLQGMDYFYGFIDQTLAHNYYPEYLWENGVKQMFDNGGIMMHGKPKSKKHVDIKNRLIEESYKDFIGKDYAAYHMQDKALGFIRENAEEPFFLYYASLIPHAALQIPDVELEPYKFEETPFAGGYYSPHPRPKAARAAMISLLDRQVGEIVALTEELGIADETLIVFTSDNGAATESSSKADIDFFNANAGFRGYKRSTTDGGVHAPMIAYWPGIIKSGTTSNHISAMWDTLPTAAELAGVAAPADIDGISFLPTLLGKGEQKQHKYLYWEFHERGGDGPSQAVRWGDWKGVRLLRNKGDTPYTEMPIMVFDVSIDPFETNDLAVQRPDIVEKLAEIMAKREPSTHPKWNFR